MQFESDIFVETTHSKTTPAPSEDKTTNEKITSAGTCQDNRTFAIFNKPISPCVIITFVVLSKIGGEVLVCLRLLQISRSPGCVTNIK